ncbi:MAG: SPOR domain-containing protein [Rhodoferax sp.]|nr:SPOR domain-containing protein [Rhodoferax sp.]
MLRFLVLLLLLLNATYFTWSHNLLRAYGFAPTAQTEPQRVAQQIRPELVRILTPDDARRADSNRPGAARPTECLLAGLFDDAQSAQVNQAAQALLPAGTWLLEPVAEPARWIIYLGKYPDANTLEKKRSELAALKLPFEALANPSLEFGLSLGGFATEAQARQELATLTQRGLRTATVVQERAERRGTLLRIPVADDAIRPQLEALKPALGAQALRACS